MTKKSFCSRQTNTPFPTFLCLLSLLGITSGYGASVPDWMKAAQKVKTGEFGKGAAGIILQKEQHFIVDESGHFVQRERATVRVHSMRAARPHLLVSGYENSDQRVSGIKTWVIAPNGRITESEKKNIQTHASFSDFELFSDSRVRSIIPPGLQDGSLLGYEVTTEGRLYLGGTRFLLEDKMPIWEGELRVSIPSGSLRWFLNHPNRVEIIEETESSIWLEVRQRQGVKVEPEMPPFWSQAASVFVNFDPDGQNPVATWDEAGKVIQRLFEKAMNITPEIETKVQGLLVDQASLLDRLRAVSDFVSKEIRYVAIEIGIGAFQPHPAGDVLMNRYGDCKDKATLMVMMLEKAGIQAFPALIGTRGSVEADPSLPTLTLFNHAIVALPVPVEWEPLVQEFSSYDPESRVLWFDPTSDAHPLGQLPEQDKGVHALVIYPDGGKLHRVPESAPHQNEIQYEATVGLRTSGEGKGTITTKYSGEFNISRQSYYKGRSKAELRNMFERRVANYARGSILTQATLTGLESTSRSLEEYLEFEGDFAQARAGQGWFFQPLFLSPIPESEISTSSRDHPLDLGFPYTVSARYQFTLPSGADVGQLPGGLHISSEFGEFTVSYEVSENTLFVKQSVTFSLSRISAEKYPDFRAFVNQGIRFENKLLRARF